MRKIFFSTLTMVTLSIAFSASCKDEEEESFDNVAGCQELEDKLNECVETPIDMTCDIYADLTTCSIGDYWDCVNDAYGECDEASSTFPDYDGAAAGDCASLASCG